MVGTVIGYLILLGFIVVAAGPFVCLLLLVRHYRTGAELSDNGDWWIYFGCICWLGIIAGCSALVETLRPWVGFPIFVGLVLGAVWQRTATPTVGIGALISNAGVFAFIGFLSWVTMGGGYFDKLFQVPYAMRVLQKTGVKKDDAAALAQALLDDDIWVRWGAALALGGLGPGAAPALDALVIAVEDPDWRVSQSARNAIARLGPLAAPGAPVIAGLLKKGKNGEDVIKFFVSCGMTAESTVPALISLAEDSSPEVRRQALEALAYIGPAAKDAALPTLVRVYKSEADPTVKDVAGRIHGKLGIPFSEWQRAIYAPESSPEGTPK